MSEWNINYNKFTANSAYVAVQANKHLIGFVNAKDRLNSLLTLLKNVLFDAESFGGRCEAEAVHYDGAQKDYNAHPERYSEAHAREVCGKNPQELYDRAAALRDGANKIYSAINAVGEILKAVERAESDAKDESKRVACKISDAMELMDSYLKAEF